MANDRRASEAWKQELRIAYANSQDSKDRTDAEESARWNWIVAMAAHLELGRRMKIEQNRLSYFWVELTAMNYDVAQAERAEVWIKYGDWTFKGADPTLELSDFLPSEEQYAAAFAKAHARHTPRVATEPQRDPRAIMDIAERKWWALEIITMYEPKWKWKMDVPWINEWRNSPAEHAHHIATRTEKAAQYARESQRKANG